MGSRAGRGAHMAEWERARPGHSMYQPPVSWEGERGGKSHQELGGSHALRHLHTHTGPSFPAGPPPAPTCEPRLAPVAEEFRPAFSRCQSNHLRKARRQFGRERLK